MRPGSTKRHTAVDDLLPLWRAELEEAGFPPEQLAGRHRAGRARLPAHDALVRRLSTRSCPTLADDVLGPEGTLSARKVFSRRDVIVAVAPHLYGLPPGRAGPGGSPGAARPGGHRPGRRAPGHRAGLCHGHRAGHRTGHRTSGGTGCARTWRRPE